MFDVGFWELLVIAIVLLVVMGPERLPDVAKQAAFFVRKARNGIYRMKSEMQAEMGGTPFEDLQKARQEVANLKNDIKQMGKDFVDSAEKQVNIEEHDSKAEIDDVVETPEVDK